MKRTLKIAATCGALMIAGWCGRSVTAQQPPTTVAPGDSPAPADGVRSITLPTVPYDLPPGKGRDAAAAGCILCHTTRYLTHQPPLPRATWVAEVDKMRKTFGAPVSDPQAAEIVEYLVSVRGVETPTSKP